MSQIAIVSKLVEGGMAPALAQEKAAMFVKALARLPEDAAAASGPSLYWVPGRIEVAGKHTDYAGGRSLLAAASTCRELSAASGADSVWAPLHGALFRGAGGADCEEGEPDGEPDGEHGDEHGDAAHDEAYGGSGYTMRECVTRSQP